MKKQPSGEEMERVRDQLRNMPRPSADPEFRARLRRDFMSRSLAERPDRRGRVPRAFAWIGAAAAVAAALIAAPIANRGPAWQLLGVTGTGTMVVNGAKVPLDSPDEIRRALRGRVRIELPPDTQLDVALPGITIIQAVGGSQFILPESPGRWVTGPLRASLEAGELRITTGPRFAGRSFAVETPEVEATVAGTTFAVLRLADASCVCVFEGAVAMSGATSPRDTVRAGFRRSVYRDGARAPLVEPISPMEAMKLDMLRSQAAAPPR